MQKPILMADGLLNWILMQRFMRWGLIVVWTGLMGMSLAWNISQHEQAVQENARIIARTAFEKDVLYRRWNSDHGGVYVPVTPNSPPNPYLADNPARDLTSDKGNAYTLINPAYMTRQVFELQVAIMGVSGHITSLNPIRPQNGPDPWESESLLTFETGSLEASAVQKVNGQDYLRLMRPLMVEERCLKCHAKQGYSVGQVRGGISETVPLQPLRDAGQTYLAVVVLGHGGIWFVGLIGILFGTNLLGRSLNKQKQTEEKLLEMSTHDALTGLYNRAYFENFFIQIDEIKSKPVTFVMADIDGPKRVNDQQGHSAGDELIRRAAEVFHAAFRAEDVVARIGGDEFVIILPGVDEVKAEEMKKRLLFSLERNNANYPDQSLGISIGLATTAPDTSLNITLQMADQRMYENKKAKSGH